jgi:hypothetical protein
MVVKIQVEVFWEPITTLHSIKNQKDLDLDIQGNLCQSTYLITETNEEILMKCGAGGLH